MNNLTEIEVAIQRLPQGEIQQLSDWLQECIEVEWDKQIEEDAAAGRLDELIAKAEADIDADNVRSLCLFPFSN